MSEHAAEGEDRRALAHGQLAYLQIPATDVGKAAEFYGRVFRWSVEPPQPGFSAPGLIGQWVDDRPPAADAGPMLWISVDDLEVTLGLVRDNGGEVVQAPSADGPRTLATIADPTGNQIGLAAH